MDENTIPFYRGILVWMENMVVLRDMTGMEGPITV